jgi:DnaJ-domain-containing protein 1
MSNEQYLVSPEEEFKLSMMRLRTTRNRLLAETDWYANSDVTMSDDIKTYRQELRDLTNGLTTAEEVEAVVFPNKPEE